MAEGKRLHTPEGTPPSHRTLTTAQHSNQVLQNLQELFKKEHLCDYTIIADGQCFKTHRNILASVSDFFWVMLTGNMLEARQDHVELKGVTAKSVKVLLDFAYTGRLSLSMDDVGEVLAGASHLQMKAPMELCSQFLVAELSLQNCVDIMNTAEMYSLEPVVVDGIKFSINHFDKLVESNQYLMLHHRHLASILQSDDLVASSELYLFNLVQQWVEYDSSVRNRHVFDLLENVRFALMSPEELVDKVTGSDLVRMDDRCRSLTDEALQYHVLPHRQPLIQSPRTQIRNQPCIVTLGGRYGINIGYKFNCNKMFALCKNKWYALPEAEVNFLYAAVCVVDNFLYVCGGMGKPAHARGSCYRFDPRTGLWTQLSRMLSPRQSFPLVANDKKLYAFGGGTPIDASFEHRPTNLCEVYSIDRNKWIAINKLPHKRKSSAACEHRGKLYISGGRTDSETVSTLWCYDPVEDIYTESQSMIEPHAGHAMIEQSEKLYVIDRTNLAIEMYCPTSDEWTKVRPPVDVVHSGVARPTVCGAWVYCLSYVHEDRDYQCKRFNVLTLETEELPCYPINVHCVIGAALTLSQSVFKDFNNNS